MSKTKKQPDPEKTVGEDCEIKIVYLPPSMSDKKLKALTEADRIEQVLRYQNALKEQAASRESLACFEEAVRQLRADGEGPLGEDVEEAYKEIRKKASACSEALKQAEDVLFSVYQKWVRSLIPYGKAEDVWLLLEGLRKLLECAEKFDPGKGTPFMGFAKSRISFYLSDKYRKDNDFIKGGYVARRREINRIINRLRASLKREPTLKEIADEYSYSEEKIQKWMEKPVIISADDNSPDDDGNSGSSLCRQVADPSVNVEMTVINSMSTDSFEKAVSALSPREQIILRTLRQDLSNDTYNKSDFLKKVGKILNMSSEEVSVYMHQAVHHLRRELRNE